MHLDKRLATSLALCLITFTSADGRAENPLVDTQTFRPSPHARDLFATVTSEMANAWEWAASLWVSFGMDPLVFVDAAGARPDHEAIQTQLSLHATGSLALTDWLSVGLEVPFFVVNDGEDTGFVPLEPIASSALGDIRLSAKLGLLRRAPGADGLGLALELPLGLPTGDTSAFVSDGWSFVPAVALDLRLGRFLVAANLGARLRDTATLVFGTEVGPEAVFRLGASFEIVPELVTAVGEIHGSSHNFAEANNTYVEGLIGATLALGKSGLGATLAAGRGLAEGYGSTSLRIVGRIGWEPPRVRDRDEDGIDDTVDRCPTAPEDKDGYEDGDGCPDPDNDGDGLLDAVDRCPSDAEDKDGFEDDDGCVDGDNDGDGVPDVADGPGGSCKDDPEDKDGFQDEDGCSDPDNDGDGITDLSDGQDGACKNDREDKDGYQDDDGCPDPDNDGDGILDATDNCPSDATNTCGVTFNSCEIVIDQTVYFEYDRAIIKPESFAILDAVAALLATRDIVKLVEVQGHTDNEGDDTYNKDLSQRRAESVRSYLMAKGIAAARLSAAGYGETKPLTKNTTPAGRAKNRRVQFIILEPAQTDCGK